MEKKLGRGLERLFKDIPVEQPSQQTETLRTLTGSSLDPEGSRDENPEGQSENPERVKPSVISEPQQQTNQSVVSKPVVLTPEISPKTERYAAEITRENLIKPEPLQTPLQIKPIERTDTSNTIKAESIIMLKTNQLIPNRFQPRKSFDKESLTELIESIKSAGVLQPILVRQSGNYYEIVAGERRWRACLELKIASVPVIIKEVDDQKMLEWALIENTQRKDLNPIERAQAYKELMTFFNLTQEEIAQRVGLDRATVSNFIRLLDLPNEVQDEVAKESITTTHARSLLSINDPSLQVKLCQRIKKEGMSVRRLEYIIRWLKRRQVTAIITPPSSAEKLHLREIEDRLRRKFNTKTTIYTPDNKQGKIIISFYSIDDFQRILDKLDQIPNVSQ
jgi:ParB family chromosome partitioning protein